MILWVGFVYRIKYYFVWGLAESGLILCGLCYNGNDGEGRPLWNKYINARIRCVLIGRGCLCVVVFVCGVVCICA